MTARDHGRAVTFISNAALKKVPGVVRQLVKEFNLLTARPGAGRTPGTGKQPAGAAPVRRVGEQRIITGKPKADEVDWTRSEKSVFIQTHGQVYDKRGNVRKW
jgi:hypothetical protein